MLLRRAAVTARQNPACRESCRATNVGTSTAESTGTADNTGTVSAARAAGTARKRSADNAA